jgi:hypothetical protein
LLRVFLSFPGVVASSNPGLELANAFGVSDQTFGVSEQKAQTFGVKTPTRLIPLETF